MRGKFILAAFSVLVLALVGSAGAATWTGAASSAWSDSNNWNPTEPTIFDDAYLYGAGIDPIITEDGEEVAWLEMLTDAVLTVNSGSLTVAERIVLGSDGIGAAAVLTVNDGNITCYDRLSIGDGAPGTLNMNGGQIDAVNIMAPDAEDTAVINLNGGIISCTQYEAKWLGSIVFNADPNDPCDHGGLLVVDGDHTQTSGGGYVHSFVGQMILDGWITTNIPGDRVIAEYDTFEYPYQTVVKSIPDEGGYGYAWGANPVNRAEDVPVDANLTWRGPAGATYDVYFGTNAANLPQVADDDSATIYDANVLDVGVTYFWKVDANVVSQITPGPIWWFKAGEFGETLVWTGNGADDLWRTPENWDDSNIPGPADVVFISPPPYRGPIIDSTCRVEVEEMFGPRYDTNDNQVMDISGGSIVVERGPWEWAFFGGQGTATINVTGSPDITVRGDWWRAAEYGTGVLNISGDPNITVEEWFRGGDKEGSHYVINMSGGKVSCATFTLGDEGICEFNLSGGTIDVADFFELSCLRGTPAPDQTINMTGGSITVGGELVVPTGTGGTATINLDGGTIDCNSFVHEAPYALDIGDGTLTITGDVRANIYADIDAGYITAYDDTGEVKVVYYPNPNKTILTGVHLLAWSPNPPDGAVGISPDVILSWSPGGRAVWHDVYLGTDVGSVMNRDPGVYKGKQDANSYEPPGDLEFGQTYYWAIDESNAPDTWPGYVWNFTIHKVFYVDTNATGANNGSSWNNAFNYLQDALAIAQETDQIWAAEGVYKTDANTADPNGSGERQATFQLKSSVAVYGGFAGGETRLSQQDWDTHETILSGDLDGNDVGDLNDPSRNENSYHVVTGSNTDADTIIDGFTITAGNADGPDPNNKGGGIYCTTGSPRIANCTIVDNTAVGTSSGSGRPAYGGGMYCSDGSHPTVQNCTISNNEASGADTAPIGGHALGGGVYCGSISSLSIRDSTINGNAALGGDASGVWPILSGGYAYGAGISCYPDSSLSIEDSTISGNIALGGDASGGSGEMHGGLALGAGARCVSNNLSMQNCSITGNTALGGSGEIPGTGRGGGVSWYSSSSPTVTNCTFSENSADSGGGINAHASLALTNCVFTANSAIYGGGLYVASTGITLTLTNCTFVGNSAENYGGAIDNSFASLMLLTNSTFSKNSADKGGALSCDSSSTTVNNCILWADTGSQGPEIYLGNGNETYPTSVSVSYSDVEGGDANVYVSAQYCTLIWDSNSNIDIDPNFVRDPNDGGDGWGEGGNDDFGDLRLQPDSNCIDAGNNNAVLPDIADLDGDGDTNEPTPRDLHGHLRFIDEPNMPDTGNGTGPIVDMGAYEYILRIYVNDNAPADPEPGNPDVSDPNEDGSRGHPFDSIREGIYAAVDGDTVVVYEGTYTGTGNRDIDFSGKAITLRSANPNDPNVVDSTIVDANGTQSEPHRAFIFQSGEEANSVLQGFTITNGFHSSGGGVYCNFSSPTLTNCVFSNNSGGDGAGMCSLNNSAPTVNGCAFIGNDGIEGGGMYNENSSPTLYYCGFIDNSGDGAGIWNEESNSIVNNCAFTGNVANQGGGMFNWRSSPIVNNCTFAGNSAIGATDSYGAGMYNYDSSPVLSNCTFAGNSAIGGTNNRCGGIYNYQSNPTVTNCILWANLDSGGTDESAQINGSGSYVVNFSCVQGWTGGLGGIYNIGDDPLLTPDQHLHSASPCRNTGDPNGNYTGQTDIDGENRVAETYVEIGADEYTDTDGDGLPNWWELEYFGTDIGAEPNEDSDGDGLTNLEEYEDYGSNPNTPPRYVPQVFSTIQDAIDAAKEGDTVLVAAGTYTGTRNKDLDFGGKLIIVHAQNGPAQTVIDCQNSGRGFNFHSGETAAAAVIGFKITNGQAGYGGAIRFERSHPQIRNCLITGNIATNQGGGIYSRMSVPTFVDCEIISNGNVNIVDIWMEYGGAQIVGSLWIADSNWTGNNLTLSGDGTIRMYSGSTLNLDQSEVICNLAGPVTMEVEAGSELVFEGNAIVDLNDPNDPNVTGRIDCDGLLRIKDNAQLINANVNVTRASFEGQSTISYNKITVDSIAPCGQFFIEPDVAIMYNDIYADGDRYMDLEPNVFEGVMLYNRIFVTITEGIGEAQGGLFELRGDATLADPFCDPNIFMCQVDLNSIPECNVRTWTIEEINIVDYAKLNLTNRFPFQPPYYPGTDDDVLYVKKLILGKNSVFNTAYNRVFYGILEDEPNSIITDQPLLGFSLINIALNDDTEFIVRVANNNYEHSTDPNYDRMHVTRIEGNEPDPNGMMQMRNIVDLDLNSATYRQVVNACAKGMFAKASEEQILIMFQYMFVEDPYDEAELVVYLSDEPKLGENLVEVARVRPPESGQYGSIGSGRFALFSGTFPRGSLNFNRGTYIELELRGADARCWVDNWDPHVECTVICGNYYIDKQYPTDVDVYDYLVLLAEFGLVGPGAPGVGKGCLDIVTDGVINTDDLLAWDTLRKLHLCPSGEGASAWCDAASYRRMIDDASSSGQGLEGQSLGESAPLLIFGKPPTGIGTAETPSSYLYSVDVNGTCVGDACEPYPASEPGVQNEGRLVTDSRGNIYHVSIDFGLVSQDTQEVVVGPQQNISYESSKISVGVNGGTGLPLSDAEFHPCDPNIVYVVPVQVTPPPGQGCPYQAAAKLQLTQTSYNVLKLYGKNPDPNWTLKTLCNDPNDFVYSPDVQHLREIEIDANGNNLFVLSAHWVNSQNWILMFDEADANSPEARVWLCDGNDNAPNVIAPTAMVVSSFDEKLYLTSSVSGPNDEPNDLTIGVWRFSIDKTGSEATGLTYDGHMDINCPQPDLCDANVCDSNWGFTAVITSITENPDDGTLYVTGFTAPKFDTNAPLPYDKLNNSIFTTPMLAVLTHDTNEQVNAIKITNCDALKPLVLPFSIVWTGDIYGGADITGDLSVTAEDFAILALHWFESNCDALNHCDGADIDKSDSVDWADLAVLAQYWLEIKCPY